MGCDMSDQVTVDTDRIAEKIRAERQGMLATMQLRQDLIPAQQHLAGRTSAALQVARTFHAACSDEAITPDRLWLLWRDLGNRLTEFDQATVEVKRIEREVGW